MKYFCILQKKSVKYNLVASVRGVCKASPRSIRLPCSLHPSLSRRVYPSEWARGLHKDSSNRLTVYKTISVEMYYFFQNGTLKYH